MRDFFRRIFVLRGRTEDRKTIDDVNALARRLSAQDGVRIEAGTRFDMARVPYQLKKWLEAVALYKDQTGLDGQDALRRHEAHIRRDAAVLHVERR